MSKLGELFDRKWVFYVGLFVLSTCAVLLLNIYLVPELSSWSQVIINALSSVLCVVLLLMLCLRYKWVGVVLLPILAFSVAVHYYIKQVFGIYLSYQLVASMLETNSGEAGTYISWGNAVKVGLVLAVAGFVGFSGHKWARKHITWRAWAWVGGAFVLAVVPAIVMTHQRYVSKDDAAGWACIWPLNDFYLNGFRIEQYMEKGMSQYAYLQDLPVGDLLGKKDDDLIIVLHLGESMRVDHLAFNGYKRMTTPNLSKRIDQIISYPRTFSYGLITRVAMVGLLSDAEVKDRIALHGSFVSLFNQAGYRTAFLTNRSSIDVHSINVFNLLKSVQDHYHIEWHEGEHRYEDTILCFDEVMKKQGYDGKQLIVIYDDGCHFPFKSNPASKVFLPDTFDVDNPMKDIQATINAYDNSVLEVDYEVDTLITKLQNKVAVYIYAGDHGVALGEDGRCGSCNFTDGTVKPAFFIWYSATFAEKYPHIVQNLRANTAKHISVDYLYHTILTLGQLKTSSLKPELDLTNPDAQEFSPPADRNILDD